MKRLSLRLLVSIIPICTAFAQQDNWGGDNSTGIAKHACRFVYPQGSAEIRSDLGDNTGVLSQLDAFIRSAVTGSGMRIQRVSLSAYSSVEGSYASNERLAYNRVESFRDYLVIRYPELNRYPIDIVWVAEDWTELSRLVRTSAIDEREEIVEIIRKVPGFDEREELIVRLNGGRAYRELQQTIFPRLRRVEIKVEYSSVPLAIEEASLTLTDNTTQQPTASPQPSPTNGQRELKEREKRPMNQQEINEWLGIGAAKEKEKEPTASPRPSPTNGQRELKEREENPAASNRAAVTPSSLSFGEGRGEAALFAIKTNALQWAGIQPDFTHTTPVANVALEYFVTPHWSVELSAMYSYWRYNHNKAFQGISGYKLGPRYHLSFIGGKFGVYLGCYGRVGDYDMWKRQNDEDLQSENQTGDYWDAGVSAGFTVGLVGGWAIEVGASAGYVKSEVISYTQDNLYNWFKDRQPYSKTKVTDLNVSLMYRFK